MKKENRKQVVLSIVAAILISVGYLNFQSIEKEMMISKSMENRTGDVELVSSSSVIENVTQNQLIKNENVVINEKQEKQVEIKNESENIIKENKNNDLNDYFVKSKLDRDNMYSKMLESYEEIVNNTQIPSTQKTIAIQEINNINNYKNGIMISENLIKNKGFEDVLILINNNTVSVVVKKEMLLDTDIAKIQNIIVSKLGFEIKNISISNVYM